MSRILFVGTDQAITDMTGKLLKRNGFNVKCAVGVAEALDAIESYPLDAVIADLEDNHIERTRFCQEVKQYSKVLQLLMITDSEEDEIQILNAGADDWMKKPYPMKVLYARINALLRNGY